MATKILNNHGLDVVYNDIKFIARYDNGERGNCRVVIKLYKSYETGDIIAHRQGRHLSTVTHYKSMQEMISTISHENTRNEQLMKLAEVAQSVLNPQKPRGRKPKVDRRKNVIQKCS